MLRLQRIINATYDEEMALINADTLEEMLKGDEYHNDICAKIEGFFEGLDFAKVDYEDLGDKSINTDDELFEILDFYNGEED